MHVAVVGTGGWSRVHLTALSRCSAVSQVTLVGRNQTALDALAAEFSVVQSVTTELDEPLDDSTVDLVDIVLPHHLHHDTTIAALDAGKHVVCEKPASLTLDQFDTVLAKAAEVGRRYLVVMNQMYNPVNLRVRQLVDEGTIGRPFLLVENAYANHATFYRDPDTWRTRLTTSGGGVLIDGGYHMVYKQLFWLAGLGYPTWVTASAAQLAVDRSGTPKPDQGEDFVSYTAGYNQAARINASHAWTLAADVPDARFTMLAGSEGTIEVAVGADRPVLLFNDHGKTVIEIESGPTSNADTMQACLADYVEAIAAGRPVTSGTNELSRQTLQMILAIYESSAIGARVELPINR